MCTLHRYTNVYRVYTINIQIYIMCTKYTDMYNVYSVNIQICKQICKHTDMHKHNTCIYRNALTAYIYKHQPFEHIDSTHDQQIDLCVCLCACLSFSGFLTLLLALSVRKSWHYAAIPHVKVSFAKEPYKETIFCKTDM